MSTQMAFDQGQYLQLLDLAYEVAQSLKGRPSPDHRWPDCQQLAVKLFFHAATIYWLRQGTKAPVPRSEDGAFFYDFASSAVLARAALETYLTMFEVFFEPATEDEFEFNHALWLLSGFVIREGLDVSDPALKAQAEKDIREMRTRLQKTTSFKALKRGEQKDVLKGKRRRDWKNVARAAGFGEQTIRQLYSYYSGYVHADGLSGTQIVSAQTAQDQVDHIEIHMRIVMSIISKMIIEYAKKFPEARTACDERPEAFYLAQVLSRAMSLMP